LAGCWSERLNPLTDIGGIAEFEREMIRERTHAGLHEARARGHVPGRKPKISAEQKKRSSKP
jgi:DNA invertase Pin-like site-specific DNA recombinase